MRTDERARVEAKFTLIIPSKEEETKVVRRKTKSYQRGEKEFLDNYYIIDLFLTIGKGLVSSLPDASSLPEVDEEEARQHKDQCERNDPTECPTPPDAVDVEEKIGEPLVASDEVASSKACSSMMGPRAVLMSRAVGFISAKRSALTR